MGSKYQFIEKPLTLMKKWMQNFSSRHPDLHQKSSECFRQSSLLHSLYSSISTVGVCTKVSQYVQLYGARLSYLLFHFRSQGVAVAVWPSGAPLGPTLGWCYKHYKAGSLWSPVTTSQPIICQYPQQTCKQCLTMFQSCYYTVRSALLLLPIQS